LLLKQCLAQFEQIYPLKISVDVARLFPIKSKYKDGEILYDRLVLGIIPAVLKHLEDTFESYDVEQIQLNETPCENLNITNYANKLLKSNFHIVFNYEDVDAGYTAYAGVCKADAVTQRPVAAFVYINIRNNVLDDRAFTEQVFTTLLHEIHHGLGFLSSYIPLFWDRDAKQHKALNQVYTSSPSYKVRIKTPGVLKWIRDHYNCQSTSGAPLENMGKQGSQNSHFEATVFGNEVMNPSAFYNLQYTGATIAYMEDMGYFRVLEPKDKMAEILHWGYKKGCGPL